MLSDNWSINHVLQLKKWPQSKMLYPVLCLFVTEKVTNIFHHTFEIIFTCIQLRHKKYTATIIAPSHCAFFFWLRLRFLLSQQMGCMGLNGSVDTMRLQKHHQLLYSPLQLKSNRSRNQTVWTALYMLWIFYYVTVRFPDRKWEFAHVCESVHMFLLAHPNNYMCIT